MDKFSTKSNATFEIKEGASTGAIVAVVADFVALGILADALTLPGNLDQVRFATDDTITGVYDDMAMDAPLFNTVDVVGGTVQATFAIRPKTATEMRLDALEDTTDLLVMDSLV